MNKERQRELIERMNYITVLDFEAGRVFQYKIPTVLGELAIQHEDYEHYLSDKGHRLNNCEWMVHENWGMVTQTEEGDVVNTI